MPELSRLARKLAPSIARNLRALQRMHPGVEFRTDAAEAEELATLALLQLRSGCDCSERFAPPERRRENDFWSAVGRCEERHGSSLADLANAPGGAGAVPIGTVLTRQFECGPATATVGGAGCQVHAALPEDAGRELLAAVLRRFLAGAFPGAPGYTCDARFWQWQRKQKWAIINPNALVDCGPGTEPIRGYYLGYRIDATLTIHAPGHYGITLPFPVAPVASLTAAAEAARECVLAALQPHRPRHGWAFTENGQPVPLAQRHEQFWEAVFSPNFRFAQWNAETCAGRGGQRLFEFLRRAVVGGLLPGAAGLSEFSRSITFADLAAADGRRLVAGKALLCAAQHRHRQTNGYGCRHCRALGLDPPARPLLSVFFVGSRCEWPAWRCIACNNHWYATDPRQGSTETCPLCEGAHSLQTVSVWRPIHEVRPDADDGFWDQIEWEEHEETED